MASLTDLPNDLKQMGLDNPKDMATVVRQGEISDKEKDVRRGIGNSLMRGAQKAYKHCAYDGPEDAPITSRANKLFTSRGIKRMMARVDKAENPRRRNRRPRNGFAD